MSDPAIQALIREVLAEELAKLGRDKQASSSGGSGGGRDDVKVERVSVGSDAELARLVARVLELAANPKTRRDLERGRLVFKLAGTQAGEVSERRDEAPAPAAGETATIESGVLSERQVDRLPKETRRLMLGKAVKLTPLARDRLGHRGIRIERTDQ